jgi:hypothetical protein
MKHDYAIFTPDTTYLWSEATGELPGKYLKRLCVLFDKIVIAPVGIGKIGTKNSLFNKNSDYLNSSTMEVLKYSKDLDDILLDIDEFLTEEDSKDYDISNPDTLLFGEKNSYFIDFVTQFVCNKFMKKSVDELSRHGVRI